MENNNNLPSIYGSSVFNDSVMRERLPKPIYKSLRKTIDEGASLDSAVAEVVANAMKDWAVENGATHFTHWFQPLTGITAEKHDAFISPTEDGRVIMEFSGKELIKGEPDASSFPSGGLRATFEARGYTAWDCTSPAFIKDGSLYIPTAFCSYSGEALDKKTPLLRSMEALSKQAIRILKLFGNNTSKKVIPTMGPEQEYFLIDRALYEKRMDLMLCGRTLFGNKAPKGQELEDHYFGKIRLRVSAFMKELDEELWKLGVSAKTKHNEVAPAQHELAPIFSSVNIACDHNQLTMELMKKIAKKHGLACLLHEKPFEGVNGSGKHNNWSMSTDDGQNLLDPGKTPHENAQFLVFLCAIIKAVHENSEMLRMSVASAGNDHRLGANEAPPAIVSIYLGDELTAVLDSIANDTPYKSSKSGKLEIGVTSLPALPRDSTDRNRTSPFAFTGNKFEFRMCGSEASIATPCTTINTIVADVLSQIADKLETAGDFNTAVDDILKNILKENSAVIFNGNNYSDEWLEEAKRRGLPNLISSVDAIPAMISEKNLSLYERQSVLTRTESYSRYDIALESYSKNINIEALIMLDMAKKQLIPAAMDYCAKLCDSVLKVEGIGADAEVFKKNAKEIAETITKANKALDLLSVQLSATNDIMDNYARAKSFHQMVIPCMDVLRAECDKLECLVDEKTWPVPSYFDLMFRV